MSEDELEDLAQRVKESMYADDRQTSKQLDDGLAALRSITEVLASLRAEKEAVCPFCKESGFDLEGLDNHLHRYCEKYGGMHAQAQRIADLETALAAEGDKAEEMRINLRAGAWCEAHFPTEHDPMPACAACEIVHLSDELKQAEQALAAERSRVQALERALEMAKTTMLALIPSDKSSMAKCWCPHYIDVKRGHSPQCLQANQWFQCLTATPEPSNEK